MRKITLLLMICCFWQQTLAQLEFAGFKEHGRIYDLTYDENSENKLYGITRLNHIVYSSDNGETWDILYSLPANSGNIEGLKFISSENALSFYTRATENFDLYIYDLDSEAITKTYFSNNDSEWQWINSYSIYENDINIALISLGYINGMTGFNYETVQYTTDGGETWQEVYLVDVDEQYPNAFLNNVAIDPENPEKLFLLRGNSHTDHDGGLFISTDSGQTWIEKLEGINLKPIAFHPENSNEILVGSFYGGGQNHFESLHKSTDGGQNWELIPHRMDKLYVQLY